MDTLHDLVYRTHQLDTALVRVWHRFTEDLDRCLGTLRKGKEGEGKGKREGGRGKEGEGRGERKGGRGKEGEGRRERERGRGKEGEGRGEREGGRGKEGEGRRERAQR